MSEDVYASELARIAEESRKAGSLSDHGISLTLPPEVAAAIPFREVRNEEIDWVHFHCVPYGL